MWAQRCREYRTQGYRHFQIKAGTEPDADIVRIDAVCDMLKLGEIGRAARRVVRRRAT